MIECADDYPDKMLHQADLCIVGTGAAGLLIAREFCATGAAVVMLEGGDWSATHANQELFDGEVRDGAFRGLKEGRIRIFGGATTLWGGQCIRLDPIDFEQRSWVPFSGWPISYRDLKRFYEMAEMRLGIAPDAFKSDVWRRFGITSVDFDAAQLNSIFGVFIQRPNLAQRYRAELKAASNIRILLRANVLGIATNAYGTRVSRVDFQTLNGISGSVHARSVILCAGGIENARLLLLSNDRCQHGLGNDRGLVGRYLQDHPCGRTALITTSNPRLLQDHYNMLYGRGVNYLPKIALSEAGQRRARVLNCVGRLAYEYHPGSGIQILRELLANVRAGNWAPRLPTKLARIARSTPELAESAWRVMYKGLSPAPRPARIFLEAFSEQTPNPNSRVTLSDRRDRLGLPQVKIDWRLDAVTGDTLREFTVLVGKELKRLGLGTVQPADWLSEPELRYPNVVDSFHPAGTTRMAESQAGGVVDINSQVYGISGLYVAGSSVFPTSGAANPTLTIAALALRLAEHVKRELQRSSASKSRSATEPFVVAGAP